MTTEPEDPIEHDPNMCPGCGLPLPRAATATSLSGKPRGVIVAESLEAAAHWDERNWRT